MAIRDGENEAASGARPPPRLADRPGLFVRTLVQRGAVARAISCSMLSPHALARRTRGSPTAFRTCRQVVVSRETSIELLAVDDDTLSVRQLAHVMLFAHVRDIAAMSNPETGRDVLVVLSEASKVSFMQYDEYAGRLRCSGEVCVRSGLSSSLDIAPRLIATHPCTEARLIVTHPCKRMVAVAGLESVISVFPVLLLKQVNAGKIVDVTVDGVISSMDFLEDDEGVPGDAILIVLVQKGLEQSIAVFTIGVPPDSTGGGLSVTFVGSMITCASHPDEVAVARATSKITGESVRPPPAAVAVSRLTGCPFLFAVFVEGKIIAGDARSVIVSAHSGDSVPITAPDGEDGRNHPHGAGIGPRASASCSGMDGSFELDSGVPRRTANQHAQVRSASPGTEPVVSMETIGGATSGAAGISVSADAGYNDVRSPSGDLSPAHLSANLNRYASRRTSVVSSGSPHRGMHADGGRRDNYLSYLYVPAYVTLDVGCVEGVATAWGDAKNHFRDSSGDGDGLYFVMESGAMFVMRWGSSVRSGTTTFVIPGGERTRTTPKRNFSVDYVGDVGPAVSIVSLDHRLLYVANDGADGSLQRLHLPTASADGGPCVRKSGHLGFDTSAGKAAGHCYALETRQEFLNLSPISDFAIAPGSRQNALQIRGDQAATRARRTGAQGRCAKRVRGANSARDGGNATPVDHGKIRSRPPSSSSQSQSKSHHSLRAPTSLQQCVRDHVLHGRSDEAELVVCSGLGRHGTVRMVRPGAPVSLFSSSSPSFEGCNDIWSMRFASGALHDAALALTFAQSTGVLLTAPPLPQTDFDRLPQATIARLVDATGASGLRSDCRSIAVGMLDDGLIAQVHAGGVRVVSLIKAGNLREPVKIVEGKVISSIVETFWDWSPPMSNQTVSVAAVGAGYVLICVVGKNNVKPSLLLLKRHPDVSAQGGLRVVSSVELEHELSCITVPEWTAAAAAAAAVAAPDHDLPSPNMPPMVILGTYAPSVEIRLLGPDMERVASIAVEPWFTSTPNEILQRDAAGIFFDSEGGSAQNDSPRRASPLAGASPSSSMNGVPESICAVEMCERRLVFVGLRDGSVLRCAFRDDEVEDGLEPLSPGASLLLTVVARRKLGHSPVVLKAVDVSVGKAVVGQVERPWICATVSGHLKWLPLAFPETRAWCSFSVPGAERCMATVASDDALHICGIRRLSDVSVRTIHIGDTPRRVLVLDTPQDSILVAACREAAPGAGAGSKGSRGGAASDIPRVVGPEPQSELRVYNRRTRQMTGRSALLPGELVHVLQRWASFVVVGTSCDLRSFSARSSLTPCERGRLLLYTVGTRRQDASVEDQDGEGDFHHDTQFELCSEVILPGAILAGDVHKSADLLVVSCNEHVFVFGISRSRSALVEIARVSTRMLVVSISIHSGVICVADRKDSLGFFKLDAGTGKLVRDRSDHRKRVVADIAMVDNSVAVATDRFGALFTLGYDEGDAPRPVSAGIQGFPASLLMAGSAFTEALDEEHAAQDMEADGSTGESFFVTSAGGTGLPTPVASEFGDEFDTMQQDSDSEESNSDEERVGSSAAGSGHNFQDEENNGGNDQVESNADGGESDENDDSGIQTDDDANDSMVASADEDVALVPDSDVQVEEPPVQAATGGQASEVDPNRPVQRNLVSRHSYNMNDTALRLRVGRYRRHEMEVERPWNATDAAPSFWNNKEAAVLCGTLGGAIIVAVPISPAVLTVLLEVAGALAEHPDISGPALGSSHDKFRAAYDTNAQGTVDGDLLGLFSTLDCDAQLSVVAAAGCPGTENVERVTALIQGLFERVA